MQMVYEVKLLLAQVGEVQVAPDDLAQSDTNGQMTRSEMQAKAGQASTDLSTYWVIDIYPVQLYCGSEALRWVQSTLIIGKRELSKVDDLLERGLASGEKDACVSKWAGEWQSSASE